MVPRIIAVHPVHHQMPEMIRELVVTADRTEQRGFHAGVGCVGEHVTVALVQRQRRVVLVEHGVGQSAHGAHDRHRAVAQRDELRQPARLEMARHDHHVRARVNQVRELIAVTDFQMTIRAVVQMPFESPEMFVDGLVRTFAEQHKLRAVVERVKDRVPHQLRPLLRIEAADEGDDRLRPVRQQEPPT